MSDAAALARVRVVLCATSHPGNIGAAARAMKTMGLGALHLVRPRRFPDPQALALASRAHDVLDQARVHATFDAALEGCVASFAFSARPRHLASRVLTAREAAREALACARSGDVALVFGNETFGLTNDELERCTALAYIPASERYASLNLAAAVQVACYEAFVAASEHPSRREPTAFAPATHDDVAQLFAHAQRTLTELGFLRPERPRKLMPRLRRLLARRPLEHEEVNMLRGILSAVDAVLARARGGR